MHAFVSSLMAPLAAMLAVIVSCVGACAATVSPVQIEMTSTGQASRAQITLQNPSASPMPVEIEVQRLTLDENGTVKTSKTGDEFLVLPPQILVQPGATQVFRVQWVGEPELAKSQSYILTVKQIPVKPPLEKATVLVVNAFGVIVNVAPPRGTPRLDLVSTGVITSKDGKRHPTLTLSNPSNVHALLSQSTIRVSSGSWSAVMFESDVQVKMGVGLVEPGKRRKFVLPIDLPAGASTVQASVEYRPKR